MPEIWVGRTTLNGEKEEDGHTMFNLHSMKMEIYAKLKFA